MLTGDILLRELDDKGILRLTLNDSKRRNALSEAMIGVLSETYRCASSVMVDNMLANTPAMLESHYGVPMCGGVLHSINTAWMPRS